MDFINFESANSRFLDQEPLNKLFDPPWSNAVFRLSQYVFELASKTKPDVCWFKVLINPVLALSSTLKESTELLNIRDEMIAEINQTLYLFTLS